MKTFLSSSISCSRSFISLSPSPSRPSIFSLSSWVMARMRFSFETFFASLSLACQQTSDDTTTGYVTRIRRLQRRNPPYLSTHGLEALPQCANGQLLGGDLLFEAHVLHGLVGQPRLHQVHL